MPGNIKKSYGIICCRESKDGVQILMIKKATTYHYCEFVHGHYDRNRGAHLTRLFNNMTYHEKMDVKTTNYATMWYRIYHEKPEEVYLYANPKNKMRYTSYYKKKNKYEKTFLGDGGQRLLELIANSKNVDTPWEFPKGRRADNTEDEINTAIRECKEETGVSSDKYQILWGTKPYIETYQDFKTIYKNTYYFARAVGDWEPEVKFSNDSQINEVSDVKWVSKQDLKHMKLEEVTYNRLLSSFTKIIKRYKSAHKPRLVQNPNSNIARYGKH